MTKSFAALIAPSRKEHGIARSRLNVELGTSLASRAYRKLDPDVLMVESTKHWPSFDTPVALNAPSVAL